MPAYSSREEIIQASISRARERAIAKEKEENRLLEETEMADFIKSCCCGEFAKQFKDGQFEPDDDGTWNINGCCGGECFVVTEMKFCPYCGATLVS